VTSTDQIRSSDAGIERKLRAEKKMCVAPQPQSSQWLLDIGLKKLELPAPQLASAGG
jgi:hypothetical protein